MLPISDKTQFKVLQILAGSLSLLLVYQLVFSGKNSKSFETKGNENIIYTNPEYNSNHIQVDVETISSFSNEEIEQPVTLSVGRNLFQNDNNNYLERISSKEASTSVKQAAFSANLETAIPQITQLIPNKFLLQSKPAHFSIKGTNFSENSKVYANGSFLESHFIDSSQIEVFLPTQFLSAQTKLEIEIKTQKANKEIVSNTATLAIIKPPSPNFTFVGTFSDLTSDSIKVLLRVGKEDMTFLVGELVKNQWKIVGLNSDVLILEDVETKTSYRIKKGEQLVFEPIKEVSQEKIAVTTESTKKISETNLFQRSSKPMTSKELWEKRASMAREKKN